MRRQAAAFVGSRSLTATADRPTIIDADPTLLRVAFSNVIDNALKFSPPTAPVEVHVTGGDQGAVVSIRDYGPGIGLEEQPHIFEKFYRSTKTDRTHGAGLGLYIVRRIIDLHGGGIVVHSRPGSGATFIIRLPRYSADSGST